MPAPTTATAGSHTDGTRYVSYGNGEVLTGGSVSWRNNNPGNLEAGEFASRHGAIGTDGRFAIFPDESTGTIAKTDLLQGPSYSGLTLTEFVNRYAPAPENDPQAYTDYIVDRSGQDPDTHTIGQLDDEVVADIVDAMKVYEGWTEGNRYFRGDPNAPDWVKKLFCQKGSVSPQLLQTLRYATLSGSATRRDEISSSQTNTLDTSMTQRNYVADETINLTARVLLYTDDASAQFGHLIKGVWKRTQHSSVTKEDGASEEHNISPSGEIDEVSGRLWVTTERSGEYEIRITGKSAAGPEPHHFYALGLAGHLCSDGTLSGQDSKQTSSDDDKIRYAPQSPGEFPTTLGGNPYTERNHHTGSTRKSWTFSITPASPPPEHQPLCDHAQTSSEIETAAMQFVTDVSQQMQLSMPGNVIVLMQELSNIYPGLAPMVSRLHEGLSVQDLCSALDHWWVSTDPEGDYELALNELKAHPNTLKEVKEQIIDYLASQADSFAEKVRAEDVDAATRIDELARKLRIEGLEAFVR